MTRREELEWSHETAWGHSMRRWEPAHRGMTQSGGDAAFAHSTGAIEISPYFASATAALIASKFGRSFGVGVCSE